MENNKLRQRFVKDYNLPINVFDEKLFNYYTNLYDFFPKEKWENLKSMVDENTMETLNFGLIIVLK